MEREAIYELRFTMLDLRLIWIVEIERKCLLKSKALARPEASGAAVSFCGEAQRYRKRYSGQPE